MVIISYSNEKYMSSDMIALQMASSLLNALKDDSFYVDVI